MNQQLQDIAKRYEEGAIKTQHLEATIFEEIYGSDREKLAAACADAARIRCEQIEKKTGVEFTIAKNVPCNNCTLTKDGTVLSGIENKVGGAVIPLGIAGPVRINGQYAKGDFYLPLATNEAALLAGVQRGIKAINLAGGVNTMVTFDGMMRASLVEAPNLQRARQLIDDLKDPAYIAELGTYVKDPFVQLYDIQCYQMGNKVFMRMFCHTGDAMGMNGVTKATADVTKAILARYTDFQLITISSNFCCDKKSNHVNILSGRGKAVQANVFLPEEVLKKVFKKGITSRKVERVVFNKCYLGSALAGTLGGFNVNAANPIAAFYAATGQDLAHVVSSSSCFVQAESFDDGLLFQATFPNLEVAAMGGGTMFGTARECLKLIGCDRVGTSLEDNVSVKKVAEIAAVCAISLDLNTACAQASGYEMAEGHVRLARGEKD
ncbi:MAG: hypothetical protein ACOX7F_06365 [Eubacteriales bacterium]